MSKQKIRGKIVCGDCIYLSKSCKTKGLCRAGKAVIAYDVFYFGCLPMIKYKPKEKCFWGHVEKVNHTDEVVIKTTI